ncbi:MAG: ABC transporter permease [Gemmatimonadaceae bacterium]
MSSALRQRLLSHAGLVVGLTFILLVVFSLSVGLGGFPVIASLRALLGGAFGSPDALLSATIVRAVPLLLTGLAVALAFRAGVMNIGAEGQLLIGAAAAVAVGLAFAGSLGRLTVAAELVAAAAGGVLWALPPAWLRRQFGVLEVISTIMMNFLALHLVSFLVRGPLQEPSGVYPQSSTLDPVAQLPALFSGTRLHWGAVLAASITVAVGWVLRYTAVGFRIVASGANPTAAREAGLVPVSRLTFRVFLLSAAFAGLAGGIQVTGVTLALYENLSPGYGYTAIAVALLAGLKPAWLIPSSVLFGALDAGAAAMQRDVGVPAGYVAFLQALIMLALLVAPRLARLRQDPRPSATRSPASA